MKAIIVDDEAKSRRMLKALCEEYCDSVEIIGMAQSVQEALELLKEKTPDILFLDIQMPIESGFSLLEYYDDDIPFEVIFTTAYDQYALPAFKFSAIDYLLKPIDIDALISAVEKVYNIQGKPSRAKRLALLKIALSSRQINKIALNTTNGFIFVNFDDIVRCEAQDNYTTVHLLNGTSVLITKTLKHYEDILRDKNFFRAHKSHLINLKYVRKFIKGKQGLIETTDGLTIEVSNRKREALLHLLANMN